MCKGGKTFRKKLRKDIFYLAAKSFQKQPKFN